MVNTRGLKPRISRRRIVELYFASLTAKHDPAACRRLVTSQAPAAKLDKQANQPEETTRQRFSSLGWEPDLFSTFLSRKYSLHKRIGKEQWVKPMKEVK